MKALATFAALAPLFAGMLFYRQRLGPVPLLNPEVELAWVPRGLMNNVSLGGFTGEINEILDQHCSVADGLCNHAAYASDG